ncbi:MAG: hypothetical protein MI919_26760, partial [Holophagales bacterium]|nr:hypothetical protein [Holophagales bacterium]
GGTEGLGVGIAIGLTLMLAEGLSGGLGVVIGWQTGFVMTFFRPFYMPLHFYLVWPEPRPELYHRHPVVWDDCCQLEYLGLNRLLVAHAELHGDSEIERLIEGYSAQRYQALWAKTVLLARQAGRAGEPSRVEGLLRKLPAGEKGFLKQTTALREKALEITRLETRIAILDRPFLAEPFVELLIKTIEQFADQIAGFEEPLASEFRKAAKVWMRSAEAQQSRIRAAANARAKQVFRAGDPINRENEAYLFRGGPIGEIERQTMLVGGSPGLVVYGRRRMGKTTLIRNLQGVLPSTTMILYFSMQAARAFDSEAAFVSLLGERLLAVVDRVGDEPINLMGLEKLLDRIDSRLEKGGARLLLALDEYEMLDKKIGQGVFSEDLLASVRESIQNHRRISWTFIGSHQLDELNHAPWSSYLVSARTIDIEPFSFEETYILLTEPMKHSPLWQDDEANRPSFHQDFWGEDGIKHIHRETGGWPHLVQLVAESAVDLVNDAGSNSIHLELLELSLKKAVRIGHAVFHQLLNGESHLPGEWSYLREFAVSEIQPPPRSREVLQSLRRRLLVEPEGDGWRLRAPIMGRWLRERL